LRSPEHFGPKAAAWPPHSKEFHAPHPLTGRYRLAKIGGVKWRLLEAVRTVSIPGFHRSPGETPQSGCGCLLVGLLVGAIVAGALVAFGIYAMNVLERGWKL
jgi:hypothetical protein